MTQYLRSIYVLVLYIGMTDKDSFNRPETNDRDEENSREAASENERSHQKIRLLIESNRASIIEQAELQKLHQEVLSEEWEDWIEYERAWGESSRAHPTFSKPWNSSPTPDDVLKRELEEVEEAVQEVLSKRHGHRGV